MKLLKQNNIYNSLSHVSININLTIEKPSNWFNYSVMHFLTSKKTVF